MRRLRHMVRDCVQTGVFRLHAGLESNYYVDLKGMLLTGEGSKTVGACMRDLLQGLKFDSVGGIAVGADSIVSSLLCCSDVTMRGFVVRPEPKPHGAGGGGVIVGRLRRGDQYVMLDDVATTGRSLINGIQAAQDAGGGRCVAAAVVLDRGEGAAEALGKLNVPLFYLVHASELFREEVFEPTEASPIVRGQHPRVPIHPPRFRATLSRGDEFVTTRIDDDANPEFWMEVISLREKPQ